MSAAAVNMAETARRAEIRPNTLTNWKSGKTERPRRNDIEKVARVLGVSPDWLLTGEGPMLPPLQTPTFVDVARDPADPYTASPTLDLGLLTRALTAALSRSPQPTPEAAARAAVEATLAAQRTGKGERIADLVEVLLP